MNGHAGAIFVVVLGVAGLILVAGIFLARRCRAALPKEGEVTPRFFSRRSFS
jgi:hypothetical protein